MSEKIENWIDEALRSEPSFHFRGDFRDRVVKAIRKKEKSGQRKLYFWMVLGILTICGFGYGLIAYFIPTMFQGLGDMNKIVPFAIVFGIIVAGIQYLDKKLVKDKLITPHV